MSGHTPGPWRYEPGGGHAHNSIRGSESIQVHGWPERRGGISNASYSDMVCENLGDTGLPGPAANARLIAAAPCLLSAAREAERVMTVAGNEHGVSGDYGARLADLRAAIAKAVQS